MAEVGCLKDGHFQNLQVNGRAEISNNLVFKRPVQTFTPGSGAPFKIIEIQLTTKGEITLVPYLVTTNNHTILLPPAADCVGVTWTFIATGTIGSFFDVITNGSEKILGTVPAGVGGANDSASAANASCGFAPAAVIGSRFSITCILDSVTPTVGAEFMAHDIVDGLAANTGSVVFK